ncbi:MAG TPA: DUF6584 family protein [Candidatus Limnocylindrales bacterium]|nr:DUF6584 family protein [Candidatus Limnocylindrales bacterium]
MAKQDVLARVEQDLERGHTHLALQRLAALAAEHPDDPRIRALRGLINHRIGNFAEAGRWGFLTEEVDEADLAAFERAFKHPWDRLRALKLRYDPSSVLGPRARERLDALLALADESGPDSLVWTESGPFPRGAWWSRALGSGCGCLAIVGVIVLIAFAVYGFLAFFDLL